MRWNEVNDAGTVTDEATTKCLTIPQDDHLRPDHRWLQAAEIAESETPDYSILAQTAVPFYKEM